MDNSLWQARWLMALLFVLAVAVPLIQNLDRIGCCR